ncbi:MAG: MBL fold metallo-hydrolase [Chloroflexi bacterium]|nr:MBL fold metallo-hydrolase [Chloroflexota bacterium]
MMRITLLGTGTPILDPKRQPSALFVEVGAEKLLFDAGWGTITQLVRAGIRPQYINPIFITHHHYDHIGNLGEFLLTSWYYGREEPLNVHGPPGTAQIVAALLEQVYAREIAFALFNDDNLVDIRDLVQVKEVARGLVYDSGKCQVLTEYVEHGNKLGLSRIDWPCLGYRIEAEGKVVAISGDTVACAGLDRLADGADVLIQCCYLAEAEIANPAFERLAQYIIASSGQVGKIATRNKVKKLVLTHIRPKSEAMMQSLIKDVRKDYSGELYLGEDLMVIEV